MHQYAMRRNKPTRSMIQAKITPPSVTHGAVVVQDCNATSTGTIFVPIICLLIPTNEIYTHEIKLFLAVTSFCILIIAFELMLLIAIAILFPFAYMLVGT